MEQIVEAIRDALVDGDAQSTKEKTEKALAIGVRPKVIILEGLLPAMKIVGDKFRENKVFIPDVLIASRAMHASLYILRPVLTDCKLATKGRVVLGTVAGDLHDIGKNMVAMMLEGEGYEVIDIGIDVTSEKFIAAVRKYKPDILAMSALLTTTMAELTATMSVLKKEGLRDKVKVMVGGGPVTSEFAMAIEADAYAADSYNAVQAANRLMKGESEFVALA